MTRHQGLSVAERADIEARGGVVEDTADGYAVLWPDGDPLASYEPEPEATAATAEEIETAVQRAAEYGTHCMPVWRERGTGWYVAESREEHPGYWYLCQIDERTGKPVGCECVASHCCHHLGAAISVWRERAGWTKNEADVLALLEESVEQAQARRAAVREEEWV